MMLMPYTLLSYNGGWLQACTAGAEAASALSRLWKQSAHAKLLQRPPAQKISPKHAALLQDTTREVLHLMTATNKAAAAYMDIRKHSSDHPRLE
jgi:hypothetical protein